MPEGATGCDPAVAEERMNALDQALADLVDAARKIGEWKAEPAPLTPTERGAWNLRIAELTAAEANARQTIHRLCDDGGYQATHECHMNLPALAAHMQRAGWHLERWNTDWASFRDGRHLPARAYRRAVISQYGLLVEHRALGGYVRDVSDGPKRFQTLDELDALLAQCGLKSKPYEGPKT